MGGEPKDGGGAEIATVRAGARTSAVRLGPMRLLRRAAGLRRRRARRRRRGSRRQHMRERAQPPLAAVPSVLPSTSSVPLVRLRQQKGEHDACCPDGRPRISISASPSPPFPVRRPPPSWSLGRWGLCARTRPPAVPKSGIPAHRPHPWGAPSAAPSSMLPVALLLSCARRHHAGLCPRPLAGAALAVCPSPPSPAFARLRRLGRPRRVVARRPSAAPARGSEWHMA